MKRLPGARPELGRPRALYVDLDGTLLGPRGSLFHTPEGLTARAAEALVAVHRAGISLVVVSGRTRDQMREAARILSASAYVAELGAFLVDRGDTEDVIACLGEFRGGGTPFEAMARSGAGAFLLERYAGRLEPHSPWAFQNREASMLFRGLLDPAEASDALAHAGYTWMEVLDNGVLSRTFPTLDSPEVHLYHLVPRGVGKDSAVALHRDRHGLAARDCAAVGDSLSDLALASVVGSVFIVANGLASVEAAAEGLGNVYATPSPSGAGFAEAVEVLLAG